MTILITGTNGFIGKNLYNVLKEKYDIKSINEDIFNNENWSSYLKSILEEYHLDAVFHIGACSNTLETDVQYMMTRNYESTKIIMDWCKLNGIPMIYSSSAANYGINGLYPANLYGWSKYIAEQYVISNGGIGLRYFNVYGPGEEEKNNMASVAYQMYCNKRDGKKIFLFPNKPTRDFVYVKDVISANIYAFENYKLLCGAYYDVGSGESRTFEDILNIMDIKYEYHTTDKIPIGYQFYTCSDKKKWLSDWKPKYNLEKGLEDYKNYLI